MHTLMNYFSEVRIRLNSVSLKVKLSGAVTTTMLLIFILLTLLNYYSTRNEIVDKLKNKDLPTYADHAKNEIILMIYKGIEPLNLMINDSYFKTQIKNPDPDVAQVLEYLKSIADQHKVVIGYISSITSNYYSSTGKWRAIEPEKEAWYFRFKNSKSEINFNIGRSADTKKVNLFQSVKIYDTNHDYNGAAYIGLNLKEVEQFILSHTMMENSKQMLVGADGKIIISADTSLIQIVGSKTENKNLSMLSGIGILAQPILSKKSEAMEYTDSLGEKKIVMSRYIPQLDAFLIMEISETTLTASATNIFIRTLIMGIFVFAVMLLVLLVIINKVVLNPIAKLTQTTSEYAKGNISIPSVHTNNDEIGKLTASIEVLRQKMNDTISFIKSSSDKIYQAGIEIGQNSKDLADSSSNQAARIEGVFSSMEEMSATIKETTQSSKESEALATESKEGVEYVQLLFDATMASLASIRSKIDLIKDISDKTDMLAINASIEASRAGAEGKGFAVVASEIRKLAESTAQAASQITLFTNESLKVAVDSVEKLKAVVPMIQKTSDYTVHIVNAAMEQSNASGFITESVAEINTISQNNARASEALAARSEFLIKQAASLKNMIKYFKQ